MLKLDGPHQHTICTNTQRKHSLADTDVANLALVDHLFQLLPGRVRVSGQLDIQDVLTFLLEGDRPVDQIEVDIFRSELSQRVVQSWLNVFGCVKVVPQLRVRLWSVTGSRKSEAGESP